MHVARSSYCEARGKLSWEAFAYLLDRALLEDRIKAERWLGHRVRAVDGSSVQLPRSKEILDTFPIRKNVFGQSHYPMLSIVVAADIFSCQTTHTFIGNKCLSERDALKSIMSNFEEGDISILDRNFNGKKLWRYFDDCKQFFVGRFRTGGRGVMHFNRRSKDQIVELEPDHSVRVIRGPRLKNGEYIYVVTNLLDPRKYSRMEILKLYQKRQTVEDVFLHFKNRLNAKNIRSKKVNGVLQEIYAALTMTSVIAGLRYLYERTRNKWKVSFKALVWRMENVFEIMLKPVKSSCFHTLFESMSRFGHKPQPGRSYPRFSRQPENKWIKERRRHI